MPAPAIVVPSRSVLVVWVYCIDSSLALPVCVRFLVSINFDIYWLALWRVCVCVWCCRENCCYWILLISSWLLLLLLLLLGESIVWLSRSVHSFTVELTTKSIYTIRYLCRESDTLRKVDNGMYRYKTKCTCLLFQKWQTRWSVLDFLFHVLQSSNT